MAVPAWDLKLVQVGDGIYDLQWDDEINDLAAVEGSEEVAQSALATLMTFAKGRVVQSDGKVVPGEWFADEHHGVPHWDFLGEKFTNFNLWKAEIIAALQKDPRIKKLVNVRFYHYDRANRNLGIYVIAVGYNDQQLEFDLNLTLGV